MKKKIIVTGATSGLGKALTYALVEAGYQPIPTGRNAEKLARLTDDLNLSGYALDVSDADSIETVCRKILESEGPIDGLINNAGIWLEGDFESYDSNDIRSVMDTNATGTILMTHALLPGMVERRQGVVINVLSTGALYCRKSISAYSASKWAIRGFTGCLEVECAPKGVRVMGFYPGKISTNMYETSGVTRNLDMAMTPEQGASMILTMLRDEGLIWSQVSGRSIRDYM